MHLAKWSLGLHCSKYIFPYHLKTLSFCLTKITQGIYQSKIEDPLTLVQPQVFNLEIWMMRFLIASMS